MIEYDSQKFSSFLRLRGSVLPVASGFALLSATLAVALKLGELEGLVGIHHTVTNNGAFSMYTGTLAFLLVFRTSKCYCRFWHCATSMCTFRAQLCEVAKCLISFTAMSKSSMIDVEHFKRSVVTFISLLHA